MSGVTVSLDQLVAPVPGGIGRYALNIVRALAKRTDAPHPLVGYVPRITRSEAHHLHGLLPLIDSLTVSPLPRSVLARAWQRGWLVPTLETSYSPSLFAPLAPTGRHIVTIHDTVPWTNPETLTPHGVAWHRAMGERAERYADIVIVPSETVADRLQSVLSLGKRIRVIGGAPDPSLVVPVDEGLRRDALGLPADYVTFVGTVEPRKGLRHLIESLALLPELSLVIVGPQGWGGISITDLVQESGIEPTRVRSVGRVDDATLAAILAGSHGLVMPSVDEGFGLPLVEAMSLGIPVIHSSAAALHEVAGGAGIEVDVHGEGGVTALAEALTGLSDEKLRGDLSERGRVRAADFSWDDSAEKLSALISGRKPRRATRSGARKDTPTN